MKDVDVDVEYLGGISLTIKIVASITLPGTFLEVPASALISLNHLKGKVSSRFCFLNNWELLIWLIKNIEILFSFDYIFHLLLVNAFGQVSTNSQILTLLQVGIY
jgi:hypothetical protein